MKRTALVALALVAGFAAAAQAYEFSLLNGMKLHGELRSFTDGRFMVDTEFGSVAIDADKLDYIVVEQTDPGPCGKMDAGRPGLGLDESPAAAEMVLAALDSPAPAPLESHSVRAAPVGETAARPKPLEGHSVVMPRPLDNMSIGERYQSPATFRGTRNTFSGTAR